MLVVKTVHKENVWVKVSLTINENITSRADPSINFDELPPELNTGGSWPNFSFQPLLTFGKKYSPKLRKPLQWIFMATQFYIACSDRTWAWSHHFKRQEDFMFTAISCSNLVYARVSNHHFPQHCQLLDVWFPLKWCPCARERVIHLTINQRKITVNIFFTFSNCCRSCFMFFTKEFTSAPLNVGTV